jgi:hypothetical protein
MDIKKLRVCTSNDKQFLKEFSDIFESHCDEMGGNCLKHKNCNTTLDSHWFFRTKLWELVKVRYDVGTKTVEELPDLSGFSVCTANERKFLDRGAKLSFMRSLYKRAKNNKGLDYKYSKALDDIEMYKRIAKEYKDRVIPKGD